MKWASTLFVIDLVRGDTNFANIASIMTFDSQSRLRYSTFNVGIHARMASEALDFVSLRNFGLCDHQVKKFVSERTNSVLDVHRLIAGGSPDMLEVYTHIENGMNSIRQMDTEVSTLVGCDILVDFGNLQASILSTVQAQTFYSESIYPVLGFVASVVYEVELILTLLSFGYKVPPHAERIEWEYAAPTVASDRTGECNPEHLGTNTRLTQCDDELSGRVEFCLAIPDASVPLYEKRNLAQRASNGCERQVWRFASSVSTLDSLKERLCGGIPMGRKLDFLTLMRHRIILPDKFLVYSCVHRQGCGGTGDRLNGIVTAFLLSMMLKRQFLIVNDSPLPLTEVFLPRFPDIVDWSVRLSGIIPDHLDYIDRRQRFHEDVASGVLESMFGKHDSPEFVTISINQLMLESIIATSAFPIPLLREIPNLFAEVFKLLFTPTSKLVNTAERTIRESRAYGKPFIGIHFRSGASLGQNWLDPERHAVSDLPKFLTCAAQIESELGRDMPFLITGDVEADLLREHVHALAPEFSTKLRFVNGTVAHVDRTDDVETQIVKGGFMNSWATWWILAQYSVGLVLSRSGFGETAARVRDLDPRTVRYFNDCIMLDFT